MKARRSFHLISALVLLAMALWVSSTALPVVQADASIDPDSFYFPTDVTAADDAVYRVTVRVVQADASIDFGAFRLPQTDVTAEEFIDTVSELNPEAVFTLVHNVWVTITFPYEVSFGSGDESGSIDANVSLSPRSDDERMRVRIQCAIETEGPETDGREIARPETYGLEPDGPELDRPGFRCTTEVRLDEEGENLLIGGSVVSESSSSTGESTEGTESTETTLLILSVFPVVTEEEDTEE